MSATQRRFGAAALKCRSSRSCRASLRSSPAPWSAAACRSARAAIQVAHQPFRPRAPRHHLALPVQFQPYLPRPVNLPARHLPHGHDLLFRRRHTGFPCRRLSLAFLRGVIRRRRNPGPHRPARCQTGPGARQRTRLARQPRVEFPREIRARGLQDLIRPPELAYLPFQLRDPLLIAGLRTRPLPAVNFRLLRPRTQSLRVNIKLPGYPGQLPCPFPSRSRTSNNIFTARSRSSSGYFRCAAMALNPPRYQSLQDSRGDPRLHAGAGTAGALSAVGSPEWCRAGPGQ